MTWTHWLTVAAESSLLFAIAGGLIVSVCSLGMLAALKIRRWWYRWRVAKEMSALDRLSLSGLARYRRDQR